MQSRSLKEVKLFEIASRRSLGLFLTFAVVIVWQIPHVIVLRYSLLIILGVLCWGTAYTVLRHPPQSGSAARGLRAPFAWYAAFLAWILLVALFGEDLRASVSELHAEWLRMTLILLLGFGAGIRFGRPAAGEGNAAVQAIFWGLVLHAVLQLLVAAGTLFETGSIALLSFGGISDHRANVTYTNVLALALLLADAARSPDERGTQLGVGGNAKLLVFAILFASTLLSSTRNGVAVFVILTLVGGAIALRYKVRSSRQWWRVVGGCAAVLIVSVWASVESDSRWNSFLETVPIGWNTEGERAWLYGEHDYAHLPRTARGTPVEGSAYYRVAYAKEGLKLIGEHPLGTRIGRNTFNHLVHEKYGTAGMSHAHNGFIDLGVSAGIPGMALWLAFLASLALLGWRAWRRDHATPGLALVLVVLAFTLRTLMDATLRDHIIEEFAMVAGVLAGAIAYAEGARHRGPA